MKDAVFHLRVRAVIRSGNYILLNRHKDGVHAFLPGGHVEEGEGMLKTVRREFMEELGVVPRSLGYLGVVEHAWEHDGVRFHEVNHCFAAEVAEFHYPAVPRSREEGFEFFWSLPESFDAHVLKPDPIRGLIRGWLKGDPTPWWGSTMET